MTDRQTRRSARLAAYDRLREQRPHLFANPPGAAYEIVLDPVLQEQVADESALKLAAAGLPEQNGDIGVVYADRYTMLVRDAVRFPDGTLGVYIREMSPHDGVGAAILPVLPDGRILLVRHFRHATRRWHWEIPRGFAEPGADGAATAAREVEEELGVAAAEVVHLGALDTDTGAEVGGDELYLARLAGVPEAHPAGAVEEGIDEFRAVTAEEFTQLIRDGQLGDAFTLAAYAYALARGLWPPTPTA
ncbi:NUDIX hydrolase [Catellatospora methionotrophica]|uniref:NUDIX hydrolase n=1 Tax=Catellatospora methionotrophica TaxID=121620 RepID=UPI0033E439DD